jgi:hypothetical protein
MEAAQTSWRSLGELFVERGLISEADLERALAEQIATKRRLADILVRRGLVTGHDITNALMEQLGPNAPQAARPAAQAVHSVPADGPAASATAVAEAPAPTVAPAPAPAPTPAPEPAEVVALPEAPSPAPEPVPAPAAAEAPKPAPEPEQPKAETPKAETPKAAKPKAEPKPEKPKAEPTAEKPKPAPKAPEPTHESTYEVAISAHALIAEADSRLRGAEAELNAAREAHAQVLRGLEQVRAELEARDLPTESLTRELEDTRRNLRDREDELAHQVEVWGDARREAERCGGQLSELQARLEEKEEELSEASASASAWAARASELDAETEALAGRVDSAVHALETLAATRFAANGADLSRQAQSSANAQARKRNGQSGVLYFVPKAEGYDLVERDGELPDVGASMAFGEEQFVVTKIGRSPLPFDRRNCVFLTAV